ncbi:MAG: flagellar motor switch protein FliN [Spirochaetota bacterium]|jgi:flagellar motor switch protein FliN/FliY|nr:flagellar motor switch protein FliN [Spirochaetota bacterium]
MSDGSLSQEEIDALLRGTDTIVSGSSSAAPVTTTFTAPTVSVESLSEHEKGTASEVLKAAIEAAAGNMGMLISNKVSLAAFALDVMRAEDVRNELGGALAQITMNFADGISGSNILIIPEASALLLTNLAMGQNNHEMSPMALSSLAQTITQAYSAAASSMSARLGKMVRFSEAHAESTEGGLSLNLPNISSCVRLSYQLRIEGQNSIQVAQIIPVSGVREMVNSISNNRMGDMNFGTMGALGGGFSGASQMASGLSSQIGVAAVQYPQLPQGLGSAQIPHNISVLMDVYMQLSVELGRTKKKISEILSFGEGSILELDKLAGEPVDVLVNGKLIAKGEVVVIDENFGVRVTEIVSPSNRIEYST